jgi:cation diffusion facilitator family transporter
VCRGKFIRFSNTISREVKHGNSSRNLVAKTIELEFYLESLWRIGANFEYTGAITNFNWDECHYLPGRFLHKIPTQTMKTNSENSSSLTRFAWLSISAAVITIGLKTVAYFLTGSVGLLSDALESVVNLVGAIMALAMLTIAARPADEDHAYGHSKAEYFSSGVEGTLILIAAVSIVVTAIPRLITPKPLEQVGIGLGVSVAASLVNLFVSLVLLKAGKRYNSITLEADAQHLMTDVWTSVGVLAGVGLVALTGWQRLDPIVAFIVAANIIWSGVRIVRMSVLGLMDTALPIKEQDKLKSIIEKYTQDGVEYHALRSRQSGSRRFVSFHILVPGKWTVHRGHKLLESIEADIRRTIPSVTVFTHLESLNDPTSWEDTNLDRAEVLPTEKKA